jgi:hypothetical protein
VSVGVNRKAKRLARVLDRIIATRPTTVEHEDRTQSLDRWFPTVLTTRSPLQHHEKIVFERPILLAAGRH